MQSIPDNLIVPSDLAQASASNDAIPSSVSPNASPHGCSALDLIRQQSRDSVLVDSPTTSFPFDDDEVGDAMLIESLPSTCGFSDEQTQFQLYSLCVFC